MPLAEIRREILGSFPNDLKPPDYGVVPHRLVHELLAIHAGILLDQVG
jgi:hypothetical protein